MKISISILNSQSANFSAEFALLLSQSSLCNDVVEKTVKEIIHQVRTRGDTALLEYTRRLDGIDAASVVELEISKELLQTAFASLPSVQREALEIAYQRILAFHSKHLAQSWEFSSRDGTHLGLRVDAMDSAGVYVPGGKAAYPSSVLMNVIPAKIAGVSHIIMVVPTPQYQRSALVLAAAHLAGVDRVFTIGGAQAVAALAYGTETIPKVDKIVGPGNAYVATAKRQVFGQVGIDMIAGPSEVVIIADDSADPEWIALDLCAQAEHDEQAQAILLSPSESLIKKVVQQLELHMSDLSRNKTILASLTARGALIKTIDIEQACVLANHIAPEHLQLAMDDARSWLPKLRHAGAIFLGHTSAETFGDYCAGPNHVLPTGGSARFASPLGVYDFQKCTSIIELSSTLAEKLAPIASVLAKGEGLTAHARAAEVRVQSHEPKVSLAQDKIKADKPSSSASKA